MSFFSKLRNSKPLPPPPVAVSSTGASKSERTIPQSSSKKQKQKRTRIARTPSPGPRGLSNAMLNPYAYTCTALLLDAAALRDAGVEPVAAVDLESVPPVFAQGKTNRDKRDEYAGARIDADLDTLLSTAVRRTLLARHPSVSEAHTVDAERAFDSDNAPLLRPASKSVSQVHEYPPRSLSRETRRTRHRRDTANFVRLDDTDKPLPAPPPPSPAGSLGRREGEIVVRVAKTRGSKGFGSLVGMTQTIMVGSVSGAATERVGGKVAMGRGGAI
ncbi:hypothetical protein BDN70DRAFT_879164 [Pholiota conissans]|uniref:Uncharacterized protein n=1 Tax=Pholiota conissans TaxID=109636 RepID=A0A9P5Z1G7_9AGAR|nr:hypothetical protein BDN70DRAFT_879164 [Pholiota conissans]